MKCHLEVSLGIKGSHHWLSKIYCICLSSYNETVIFGHYLSCCKEKKKNVYTEMGYTEIPEHTETPEHTGNYRNTL